MKKRPAKASREREHKNKPIHIPLSFDAAVEGLLKVKPKKKSGTPEQPK